MTTQHIRLSLVTRQPDFCLCKSKNADKFSNCTADHRLCFRFTDSTIPFLLKSKISSFRRSLYPRLYRPVCVGPGWKPRRPVFSRRGSVLGINKGFVFCDVDPLCFRVSKMAVRGCGNVIKYIMFLFNALILVSKALLFFQFVQFNERFHFDAHAIYV